MKIGKSFKVSTKGGFIFERKRQILFIFLSIFFFVASSFIYAQENVIPAIKFKDADIGMVLQSIARKATKEGKKVNIVTSPNVKGLVSINLENVNWEAALRVIMDAYKYGYGWVGDNIILVSTLEEIKEREIREKEKREVEVPQTKIFKLKFLDASDAKKVVEPVLSSAGRASVLEITGQAGWEFGTNVKKRESGREGKISRTKVLLVSDKTKKLDEIEALLKEIDVMPKQILVRTRILEVSSDLLKDIGFDLSFTNKSGGISTSGSAQTDITTITTGLDLGIRKLTGTEFESILRALEEDKRTNTLSAPAILTLNNREASILIGQKFPIVRTETSVETNRIIGGSLDFYQDIGVQLNVIPQISGENDEFVSMIIHPAVTSRLEDVTVTDQEGNVLATFPSLTTREAETQALLKDGETIVIGGLLKDVEKKQETGIPLLMKIPKIGWLFKRTKYNTEKIDLLIFIAAKIVKPGEKIPEEFTVSSPVISGVEK